MKGGGAAVAGGGLLGLLALGLLVGLRGTFHPADLVVVMATAGAALLVQHLLHTPDPGAGPAIDPAALDAQVRNLRESTENLRAARDALRRSLAATIDERMDAALAVARISAGSAREGERLAALAEELRASAERLRGEIESISRLLSDDGGEP